MKHITIIGGGMAGLSTAYYLQQTAGESQIPLHYTLIEQDDRLGGKVYTEHVGGTLIEAGPDSYISQKPWATELVHEVGLGDQLIPSRDHLQRVCMVHRGRLVPFPRGFRLAVPTEWKPFLSTPLISVPGKMRMACDWFLPSRKHVDDESLASFLRRRLGEEALQNLAGPMMSGIYSGDPERMSIQATFPMFPEMERKHGSLIRGMLRGRPKTDTQKKATYPSGMFLSLREGMGALPQAIQARLQGRVITGCQVQAIQQENGGYTVHIKDRSRQSIHTDFVVIATPADSAAELLKGLHPDLAHKLSFIRYHSTATVSLAFDRHGTTGLQNGVGPGFMVPDHEQRSITACTYSSCKFEHRTNDDTVLLRAFVGGARNSNLVSLPDNELVHIVRQELNELVGIDQAPRLTRVYRWRNGTPQYDVGHLDRMADIDASSSEQPGLFLTGSSYRGIGVPDVILQGRNTAKRILDHIQHCIEPYSPNPSGSGI